MADSLYYYNKRNFTAGELSPILDEKIDFERYVNGCRELLNMVALPQGPATRRSGFEFLYDLMLLLGGDPTSVKPRLIPFVFNEFQAYALIFFQHNSGTTRVAFATRDGLIDSTTPGVPYVFEFTGTLDIENFDYEQSNDVIKIAQAGRIPLDFARVSENSWTATEMVTTGLPPAGATGSDWSAPSNWPTRVGFFEQRIVYAATAARPQTMWFSRSGDFEDFIIGTAALDDPIALTFNSGTQNKIQWLSTARVLLAGTVGDEWDVSGKGVEPLSHNSFRMVRHTKQGSIAVKPLMVGPVTIFIEHLGRTVSQMGYDYASDSYDTVDLSVLAPHLTEHYALTGWAYQKVPYGIIWATRSDGVFCSLTMKREHNVVGWHRHSTDGEFISVTSIPGDFETDVFAIVEREIEGVTKWYLEVKAKEFKSQDSIDAKFLDSHVVYEPSLPSDTVPILSHLEGKTVSIMADGRPHPDRIVESGSVTLDGEFNYMVVGLPYVSRLVTTPPVVSMDDGTTHARITDTIQALVSVKDSAGFYIGTRDAFDRDKLTYYPLRIADIADPSSAKLETRICSIDLTETAIDPEAARIQRTIVEQRLPLPLTVLGITENFYASE